MNKRRLGMLWGLGAALMVGAPLFFMGGAQAATIMPGNCSTVDLSVALGPDMPKDQTVKGTLCTPRYWSHNRRAIDVLTPGASYNSTYWNWPIKTLFYSYVDDTLLAGRAVFFYDAVGSGASSHPASTSITIDGEAYVLHQILGWLHDKHQYVRYDAIGHSMGSMAVVAEASKYHDEDVVVLTGYSHAANPVSGAQLGDKIYPANQDPQFAGLNLDAGYLTTKPGERKTYYGASADPTIVAYDDAHKDVFSATTLGTGLAQTVAPAAGNVANDVTVPVLEMIGRDDFLFCGTGALVDCASEASVKAFDQPYFTHAPSLTVRTIGRTGHDLALHQTDFFSFGLINQWIETH